MRVRCAKPLGGNYVALYGVCNSSVPTAQIYLASNENNYAVTRVCMVNCKEDVVLVVDCFKILSWHLHVRDEENYEHV
jgi:hypothetical protein